MWSTAVIIVLLAAILILLLVLLLRMPSESPLPAIENTGERVERSVREEFGRNREESSGAVRDLRTELTGAVQGLGNSTQARMSELITLQQTQLEGFARQLATLSSGNEQKLEQMRVT